MQKVKKIVITHHAIERINFGYENLRKNKAVVKDYQQKEKLIKILNKYDPIKLIKIGCPKDEYSPEANEIIKKLNRIKSLNEMHKLIYNIFTEMFDKKIAGPKDKYRKIAKEILNKV